MDLLETLDRIVKMMESADWAVDKQDISITITVAMDEAERNDLNAMIDYLLKDSTESFVLSQVFHDLNGFKEKHLAEYDICFVPRSSGYAAKV